MNKRLPTTPALAFFACFALAGSAHALESGSAIQPGTEFPAAPISKGGLSSAPSNVLPPPGAAPAEPVAPPAPAPAPKRHRKHHKS